MATFELRAFELPVHTTRRVVKLVVNGKVPYEEFADRMNRAGKKADVAKILVLLERITQGMPLPPNASKELREVPTEDKWREYELRKNQLRVYYFLIPPDDTVVVLGEFKKGKKGQSATISRFRELKQQFKAFYIAQLEEE